MSITRETTAEEAAALFAKQITGKNVLVTGVSTNSLGAETVRVIAPYAKTVIIASRSKERVEDAIKGFKGQSSADIRVVKLDLLSTDSIKQAASEILAFDLPIHVVINNAAVPQYQTLTRSEQGFEANFGANHLGHFLLNSLILPAIRRGAKEHSPARVVTVSSLALAWGGDIRWDDPNFNLRPEEYSVYPAYAQGKMANALYARELTNRYKDEGILGFSLSPGVVGETNMASAVPVADRIAFGFANADGSPKADVVKSMGTGTLTQIAAAFDPSLDTAPGNFLDDGVIHDDRLPEFAKDDGNAARLWALSEELLSHKFDA